MIKKGSDQSMPTKDEIEGQRTLLAAHRATLAVLLRQLASLGADHAPSGVHNGIADARDGIARCKAILREWGQVVQKHPNDEAPTRPTDAINLMTQEVNRVKPSDDTITSPPPIIDPENRQSLIEAVYLKINSRLAYTPMRNTVMLLLRQDNQPDQLLPPSTRIIDLYNKRGIRILLLGPPNVERTYLIYELARDLLEAAEHDNTKPIPVFFSLQTWQPGQSLQAWMIAELVRTYNKDRSEVTPLISTGQIIPFLDGLARLATPELRAQCINAINNYTLPKKYRAPYIVMTGDETVRDQLEEQITLVIQPPPVLPPPDWRQRARAILAHPLGVSFLVAFLIVLSLVLYLVFKKDPIVSQIGSTPSARPSLTSTPNGGTSGSQPTSIEHDSQTSKIGIAHPGDATICAHTLRNETFITATMPITIAIFAPKTGAQALKGAGMLIGACWAYYDLAPNLRVVAYDDGSYGGPSDDARQIQRAAQAIADDPKTLCVVGNYGSPAVAQAISIYTQIPDSKDYPPLILPAASDSTIIADYPAWRLVGTNRGQAKAAFSFIITDTLHTPSDQILFIHDDRNEYGKDFAKIFVEQLGVHFTKSLAYPHGTLSDSKDSLKKLFAQITAIDTGPYNAILFAGNDTDFDAFIKEARGDNRKIIVPIIGTDSTDSPTLRAHKTDSAYHDIYYITMAAPPATTIDFATKYLPYTSAGDRTLFPLSDLDTTPSDPDMIRAYAAESYDAMSLCIRAINKAQHDLPPGQLLNRAAVKTAMDNLMQHIDSFPPGTTKLVPITQTYTGPYDFDKDDENNQGNLVTGYYFVRKVGDVTAPTIYKCEHESEATTTRDCSVIRR
jgi:ABC-type branched-subunit amino acid transport system substrate-binding protein